MKKFGLLFVFISFFAHGQSQANNSIYKKPPKLSIGIHHYFVSYNGFGIDLAYHFNAHYTIGGEIWEVFRDSPNTPSDYSQTFMKNTSHSVGEKTRSFGVFGGYKIQIPKTRSRLHLRTGLYYNKLKYPDNFIHVTSSDLFGQTNYSYEMKHSTYLSLVLSPSIEFPIWNHFGMRIEPKLMLSAKHTGFMMSIGFIGGNATEKVKRRKK